MSYRITTHAALAGNLAAANATVMLCRTNIERIPMTLEERSEIAWRVHLQMSELEGILAHLKKADGLYSQAKPKDNIVDFSPL